MRSFNGRASAALRISVELMALTYRAGSSVQAQFYTRSDSSFIIRHFDPMILREILKKNPTDRTAHEPYSERMIAPPAKFIDWSVLQIGYAMLPRSVWRETVNERDLKLEQAVQFLNGPDFILAESQPARIEFPISRRIGIP
jgi:hypothetical protein